MGSQREGHGIDSGGTTRSRRPARPSLRGAFALAAGAGLVVLGAGLGLSSPPGAATVPGGTALAGAAIRPSLAAEASLARARLAVNLRAEHPGRAEQLTHPGADSLGSTFGHPAAPAMSSASTAPTTAAPPPQPIGVDVSSHQGNVNWSAVAAAGDTFAWVKATEGTGYVDTAYFPQQYNGSYQAGLIRGAYHFAIPSDSTGAAQADYFVANGGGWSADGKTLPGMLDMENNPYGPMCYGLKPAAMAAWVVSFSDEYAMLTGRYPSVYTNASFWNTCAGGSSAASFDPLDLAAWGPTPTPLPNGWTSATVWQYTDSNQFGYDGDRYLGSSAALDNFALGPVVTVTTTTTTLPGETTTTYPGETTTSTTSTTTTTVPPTTTTTAPPPPPPPPNTLVAGQVLHAGHDLLSRNGAFAVWMQRDGNLVEYVAGNRALWASRTTRHPGAYALVQANGDLQVLSPAGTVLFHTHTAGRGPTFAIVQNDANFVLYQVHGRALWSAGTARRYAALRRRAAG